MSVVRLNAIAISSLKHHLHGSRHHLTWTRNQLIFFLLHHLMVIMRVSSASSSNRAVEPGGEQGRSLPLPPDEQAGDEESDDLQWEVESSIDDEANEDDDLP